MKIVLTLAFTLTAALVFLAPSLRFTTHAFVTYGAVLASLGLCLAGIALFLWKNRQLRSFRPLPPAEAPHIELSAEPDKIPHTAWLSLLPIVSLFSAAVYLHANWSRIPHRFPIHWNAAGVPNGWSERTPRGVYGLLLFASMFLAWLIITNFVLWDGVRRSRYRSYLFDLFIGVQCVFGLVPSLLALAPVTHLSPLLEGACVVVPIAALVWFAIRGATQANGMPDVDPIRENARVAGPWYFNRKDPALAVPRGDGLGYVPNFAHLSVWLLFLAPILIIFVAFHSIL